MSRSDLTGVESTGTTTAESPIDPETQPAIDWDGPFCERNAYGTTTGHAYVRCPDCAIEVLTSHREHATHRQGCQYR